MKLKRNYGFGRIVFMNRRRTYNDNLIVVMTVLKEDRNNCAISV